MSEQRAVYGSDSIDLNDFPKQLRAALELIKKHPQDMRSIILCNCLASMADDYHACHLSGLSELSLEFKEAARQVFDFALNHGFDSEQKGLLLRYVEQFLRFQR